MLNWHIGPFTVGTSLFGGVASDPTAATIIQVHVQVAMFIIDVICILICITLCLMKKVCVPVGGKK